MHLFAAGPSPGPPSYSGARTAPPHNDMEHGQPGADRHSGTPTTATPTDDEDDALPGSASQS